MRCALSGIPLSQSDVVGSGALGKVFLGQVWGMPIPGTRMEASLFFAISYLPRRGDRLSTSGHWGL